MLLDGKIRSLIDALHTCIRIGPGFDRPPLFSQRILPVWIGDLPPNNYVRSVIYLPIPDNERNHHGPSQTRANEGRPVSHSTSGSLATLRCYILRLEVGIRTPVTEPTASDYVAIAATISLSHTGEM